MKTIRVFRVTSLGVCHMRFTVSENIRTTSGEHLLRKDDFVVGMWRHKNESILKPNWSGSHGKHRTSVIVIAAALDRKYHGGCK